LPTSTAQYTGRGEKKIAPGGGLGQEEVQGIKTGPEYTAKKKHSTKYISGSIESQIHR
jgi:hypothetical protein